MEFWENKEKINNRWRLENEFIPNLSEESRNRYFKEWKKAVEKSKGWLEE